jgi:pyruvate/2-oxoglutarate/acetoin dehydrogenase E1 component
MSAYKDAITASMGAIAADPDSVFIGYGLLTGRAGGTLKHVPDSQIVETIVAENLMVGLATGLSLRGKKPVVYIERCDFLLNALDALVNHLTKIKHMSGGEFAPAAIIRVVVGNKDKPLFTGATHTQDFSDSLSVMLMDEANAYDIWRLDADAVIENIFAEAHRKLSDGITTIVFEYKDLL